MVGNVVPKQPQRGNAAPSPPHLASNAKALPVARRVLDSTKKKGTAGLADLRDLDKAKVARLINHVMVAFKEIRRLKELLELERSSKEALVVKLQQQNHEVATELRLKLASLQLMSSVSSQKVYPHTDKGRNLSPIREAECCEAESEGGPLPEAVDETQTILTEIENQSSDFATTAERKGKCIFHKSEGTEQSVEYEQMGEFPSSISHSNVSSSIGKENKDPELLPELIYPPHVAGEEDAGVVRKRPPPRPLPDLLSNILHRRKDVGCPPSEDQSESSVKSVPILQGKGKSIIAHAAQATRSCVLLGPNSVEESSVSAEPLHDLSSGLCGHHVGCTFKVPCSKIHLAAVQQCQAKASGNLDGHECMIRSEAGGKNGLCCDHLEGGGQQHEASNGVVCTHCKCTALYQCPPNCLHLSSNLTNVPCLEQLGGSEKEVNETSKHEDDIEPKIDTSQKKLRFDPTAGEEGIFYYESDVEKSLKRRSHQPNVPGEAQGVQVGGKTERVSSTQACMEGQRLDRDPLEGRWTPEAIERRNSFHKIPGASPRSMNDKERQSDELTISSSDSMSAKPEGGNGVACSEEQLQLPTSENEVLSLKYEKSYSHKIRPSSQRTSNCINCTSVVPLSCRKASQSSNLFAKHARRCSKCSSIVESSAFIHRYKDNEKSRGRMARMDECFSNGKQSSTEYGSMNEACGRGTEEDPSASEPSTPSRSGSIARCGKCTAARPKPRLFNKRVQQKQTRGQVGTTTCVPGDEEGSNPASLVYCAVSEDMYLSTHSNTDDSTKTRSVPSFPLKVCRAHTRKVKKKRGNRRDMKSVKLHRGHNSKPTQEVFDVNRAILKMLRPSDAKQQRQLKGPLPDSAECWIETWRFGKSHNNSCNESTDEENSKASSGSFALHAPLDADLDRRRGLKLGCEGRRMARQRHHVRGGKHSSETWKSFDVDDLLDRFIQSNAEYAAELIKCSVYFESTSSRPSSQSNIVSEDATEDCTLSNLPFQNCMAAKQAFGSHIVSSASGQPRRELVLGQNEFTSAQPCPEGSVRCSKPSPTVHPPIVLPRLNLDDALRIRETGRQQTVGSHPGTSEILICDVKNSGDCAQDVLHDYPHWSCGDQRMPIITGASISSRRSTPLLEIEEDGTEKELTKMFDISLYDLVNDLEGQRRDYWRRVNGHNMREGTETGKQCNNRRQLVNGDNVRGSYGTGRLIPSKKILPSHFR